MPDVLPADFQVLVIGKLIFSQDVLGFWLPNEEEENGPQQADHCQGDEHCPPVTLWGEGGGES